MNLERYCRVSVLLVLVSALGCGPLFAPASGEKKALYVISDDGSLPEQSAESTDFRLLIRAMQANNFINSHKIIFSRESATRGYYQLAQWVEPPTKRLTLLLLERFERSGSFASVSGIASSALGDLQLNTELTEFYHDVSESPGTVHLRLRAEVVDLAERRVVGERVFSKSLPAADYSAEGAVASFTAGSNALLNDVVTWVTELASQRAASAA
ncbi:MAG: membrane integrity-associated transporter subunit PqiC [Bdellovibrionales bacterium]|nr:membrane integrity-associated transporter subunit PqiC [Bdellovibrionales bacterium]